jgi:hypothetical protein
MQLKSLLLAISVVLLGVACSNCCLCIDYFAPPMQWNNYSCKASPNVTLSMYVYTLGPQPVTFLDSESDRINFSSYGPFLFPSINTRTNDNQLEIFFRMSGSSDIRPGFKSDTYVYLPRGPNYTVFVSSPGNYPNESRVTNNYTGGNITLVVNDHERMPQPFGGVTLTPLLKG